MKKSYSLAYSSCPNDTFIFKGIAQNLIDTRGMDFKIALEDVETLNQNACLGKYQVTKLSFAALGNLLDQYGLLRTGAALGMGCGPLVISLPGRKMDEKKNPVVAVPGLATTACHLLQFYLKDIFPSLDPRIIPMPFEKIMPSVLEKKSDFGVIIHEGRFVFQEMNLEMKADLGLWWEEKTNLPIPLGCIAVRRDMGPGAACEIQSLIKKSIDHGFAHPAMGGDYIKRHAQEMAEDVIQRHISLYVNEFSKDIGEKGTQAVEAFFNYADKAGLIFRPKGSQPLFAC